MLTYISTNNLARYDGKIQEYAASFCASKEDGMWRQTEQAGAVSFWPVGNSPLEGVVEFKFSETGPASGTKGPDNPSAITGVTSVGVTVCQEEGVDEHSYSLSLGGTHYGGFVDLATGMMTVTKEFAIVNAGSASTGISSNNAVLRIWLEDFGYSDPLDDGTEICAELPRGTTGSGVNRFFVGTPNSNGKHPVYVILNPSLLDFSGAADPSNPTNTEVRNAGTAFLSEHPLHMVLTLTTPFTVQLTPPQIRALAQADKYVPRLNTVYSDADAVQIVYQKNPVRDKFEKVQAIIAQGGNV